MENTKQDEQPGRLKIEAVSLFSYKKASEKYNARNATSQDSLGAIVAHPVMGQDELPVFIYMIRCLER
jgi:hypothetical protein